MKSENRVSNVYKKGTKDWKDQYEMLLDDGLTCNDCHHAYRCTSMFGSNLTDTSCQFYPNRFTKARINIPGVEVVEDGK